jgi:2,3-bisphosphoglycerate-independent phosphoglycerate mutase
LKYVLIIGDGMADDPLKELDGRTPLQVAEHSNMDLIASGGFCSMLNTQPSGLDEGTDVALLSILGYDPLELRVGRGSLEAASIGIGLEEDDLAFRCNLITVKDGVLEDYSAGHISTREARDLIRSIDDVYGRPGEIEFYPGVSYRHLLVLRGVRYSDKVICNLPHDNLNTPVSKILVREVDRQGASTAELLNEMILNSVKILTENPINQMRVKLGKNPGNMIWPWGPGRRPKIKPLHAIYGVNGAVISAVDVVNGMGVFAGLDVIKVPGATGYFDTNYEGKADYALASLKDHDFVVIHVEAPDEASHIGDCGLKVRTIEDLDKRLVGRVLRGLEGDYTIAVLPDHTTSTASKRHAREPVPFALFSTHQSRRQEAERFDEVSIRKASSEIIRGVDFLSLFFSQGK